MPMAQKSALPQLLVLALCLSSTAAQAGMLDSREQRRLGSQLEQRPMMFFIAKGPAGSCGRGCSEWIAALGKFDAETPRRFRTFTETLQGRNLPIFFHSPGGLTKAGADIGRMLRERRMTAGVGRTETRRCRVFDKKDTACQNLINRGESVDARLITSDAQCLSACVSAFVGASSRLVASGAFVGIHSPRIRDFTSIERLRDLPTLPVGKISAKNYLQILKRQEEILAENVRILDGKPSDVAIEGYKQRERRYFLEMGIDPDLVDLGLKTPPERIYLLSRGELTRFGFETSYKSFETPWTIFNPANQRVSVMKSVTGRTLSEPAEYLTLRFQFDCQSDGRVFFWYQRDLAVDSDQPKTAIYVQFGDRTLSFQSRLTQSRVETGYYFLRGEPAWTDVTTAKTMALFEEKTGDEAVIETRLSTAGLEAVLGEFQKRCVKLATPAAAILPATPPIWPPTPARP